MGEQNNITNKTLKERERNRGGEKKTENVLVLSTEGDKNQSRENNLASKKWSLKTLNRNIFSLKTKSFDFFDLFLSFSI